MPRFRSRSMMLRPIQRIKHVVDIQGGAVGGAVTTDNLIVTADAPVLGNTSQCLTGSTVHGIYLKVECYSTTNAVLNNVYLMIGKNPGGNLALPNPNVVGSSDNKKYIIHQEMIMLQKDVNSNPRTLFNGVIKIPKGYKRNGPNDLLRMHLLSGNNIDYCAQAHYKEFR